jgi:nucleotide-binding universal stress UspA family protein
MSGSARTVLVPALKNILFPTDFSPSSQAALPFLRAIAMRYGSTVHLVHVLAPEARTAVPMDSYPELDVDRGDAESAMKAMQASDPFHDIAHTATVERGQVWEVLAPILEEKKIDLIVLGTHGRRGIRKLVLGSTAEEVFRMAPCPVLTVGPHATIQNTAQAGAAPILFATDFSAGSQHALSYAVSLARASHSRLILLHAVPPDTAILPGSMDVTAETMEVSAELLADALARARRQMAELVSAEPMQDLNPETIVECGATDAMILSAAESKQASLIVMGAHRASLNPVLHSVAAHLPWAIASAVVRQAPCPVLTVRS